MFIWPGCYGCHLYRAIASGGWGGGQCLCSKTAKTGKVYSSVAKMVVGGGECGGKRGAEKFCVGEGVLGRGGEKRDKQDHSEFLPNWPTNLCSVWRSRFNKMRNVLMFAHTERGARDK